MLTSKRKPAGQRPARSVVVNVVVATLAVSILWLVAGRFAFRSTAQMIRQATQHVHAAADTNSKASDTAHTQALAPVAAPSTPQCHMEENTELAGDVVVSGDTLLKGSAEECCAACHAARGCNVWVWCPREQGCAPGRRYMECWLKQQQPMNLLYIAGSRHPAIPWTSGAVYSAEQLAAARAAEASRLAALAADPTLPLVFLDVDIKGVRAGRITMVLFSKDSPRAAENFRALCTGEKGIVPEGREGAGQAYHFKGKPFYRIIDQFIDQTGAGTESVYGGYFKDDAGGLQLKHDRRGLLSMANAGPDTNGSHFSIMVAPAPHLNGHYTIFGEVVSGLEVVEAINKLSRGQKNNFAGPDAGAVIVDSGQLRCGEPCGNPALYKGTRNEQLANVHAAATVSV